MSDRLSHQQQMLLRVLRERGASSPAELAAVTEEPVQGVLCRLRSLADRKLVQLDSDNNAWLSGQPPPSRWLPDNERVFHERRQAWLTRGLIIVHPDELPDAFLRQQLYGYACQRYGRRRGGRASGA